MRPQASCQISSPISLPHICITPRFVIFATLAGTVAIWDVTCEHQNLDNDPHKKIIQTGRTFDIDWHGSLIVTGNEDGTARLWDAQNGVQVKEFPEHGDQICSVLMPDSSTIITGTGNGTHSIHVWDIESGLCLHKLEGHKNAIRCFEVIGNRLISGSNDYTVRIWDLRTGNQLHQLEDLPQSPYKLRLNDNKTLLAVSYSGGDIKVWRMEDGACVATCHGHTWIVNQLENRNGNLVSASADGTIRTWNWEDGSLLHAIDPAHHPILGRTNAVRGMVWTERYLITAGFRDGLVKLWDKESSVLISEHSVISPGIFHVIGGEGKLVIASKAGDELYQISLWNKETIDAQGL